MAEALHRLEPLRHAVFKHLVEIAELTGADRAAAVWVDEYGSGLIHPHVVLDQLCDTPRRHFTPEPLHDAWELGVPAALDRLSSPARSVPTTLSVALGSDGTRAWFVVADSVFARPLLDEDVRDRVMFLAGECAAVLLHRDLDVAARRGGAGPASSFAGWPILEDLEGREDDEVASARIARRFVVARLVRMLVDDDLIVAPERMADQVRRARAELLGAEAESDESETQEVALCQRVLDALEAASHDTLASDIVALADLVEAQGHTHGALELYRCASSIAVGVGAPRVAVDAARLAGRVLRRAAQWEEARRYFDLTREIADVAGMPAMAARGLVGLAGIMRELGNIPAARQTFHDALARAEESRDREAIALAHHGLLGIEQTAGDLLQSLRHGWIAVAHYEDARGRARCLASLAGALADYGDREAAEDAWTVVAALSNEAYYRIYAYDALAYLAALRGDRAAFEWRASQCDALDWRSGQRAATAEILYYRGLSYRALGDDLRADEWLREAVSFAEEHKFGRTLFLAEEALRLGTHRGEREEQEAAPTAPSELREGLRAMRQELIPAGV